MEPVQILVADDEKEIRDLLKKYLEREHYGVDVVSNGEEALHLFEKNTYNLVILDVMMPGVDGIEVCRQLRNKSNVPILMLTARTEEVDKLVGLSMGADDYITKPFSINELVARVKAQVRRFMVLGSDPGAHAENMIRFKNLTLDLNKYTVSKNGEQIALTAKEFELLKFFATHPEQVFTTVQLFRQVWQSEYIEDDNTVMVHIRKLRKKIEDDPSDPHYIQTVWGIGYFFKGEPDAQG